MLCKNIQMAMLGHSLCIPQNFEIFHDIRLGSGLREDDSDKEMWGNQITA